MAKVKGNLANVDEVFGTTIPSEDIICKNCKYRDDGTAFSRPYTKGNCQKFPYPGIKPLEILNAGGNCSYYEKED